MVKPIPAVILLCLFTTAVFAGDEAAKVMETVTGTVGIQQETQRIEDDWAGERDAHEARYQRLKERRERLEKKTAALAGEIEIQRTQVAELERRLVESDRVREGLSASLETTVARLEAWLSEDLAFLPEEREIRLDAIKEVMVGDASPAEKLRRVMEALQIEVDYGGTVEVYQDRIEIKGETLLVDILRLGRLSLFYQTPDGREVGLYDRVTRAWQPLPHKYRREIVKAMEMASRRRPIELVRLPIGELAP